MQDKQCCAGFVYVSTDKSVTNLPVYNEDFFVYKIFNFVMLVGGWSGNVWVNTNWGTVWRGWKKISFQQ